MFYNKFSYFIKEYKEYKRFYAEGNRKHRRLVFYSERDIYYQYFEGYIQYVLDNSDIDVCYITSDPHDPILHITNNRIHSFYINYFLAATFSRLDSKALVMTMPDLDNYHIKRSRNNVNHVYLFHGVGSTHLQYNKNAFNAFDTIFCIGQYDVNELRKAEQLYNLNKKELIECGYYRIEKIYTSHQRMLATNEIQNFSEKTILIAPSWHKENILAYCINDLINVLKQSRYHVIIRPHPEFIKRNRECVEDIKKKLIGIDNMVLELNMVSGISIHNADVLITDWSAISYEYAFGTNRPVLFINTPCKIHNPDYMELGIEPLEFVVRGQIGKEIDIRAIPSIPFIIDELIYNRDHYRQQIDHFRTVCIANWLKSSQVGGDYLIKCCTETTNPTMSDQ